MKAIITTILMTLFVISVFSQDNGIYIEIKNLVGTNATYELKKMSNVAFMLKNISNNKDIGTHLSYIDGTHAEIHPRAYSTLRDSNVVIQIIREVFTPAELQMLKDAKHRNKIIVFAKLNTDGTLSDIQFMMLANSVTSSLSSDRIYQFEQAILTRVNFDIDPDMLNGTKGQYKYLCTNFLIDFNDLTVR